MFPLSKRGLKRLREFDKAQAYQTLSIVFHRALRHVNAARVEAGDVPLPDDIRPYDARHTIGAQIFRKTGDIYGTAEFLGVSVETALRYTRAALPDRMRVAARAIDAVRGSGRTTKR